MAMVVKNNMSAVSTLNTLNKNSSALQKSLSKVSSGMKINSAQDDASGYAISERMRVQIRSLDQANQNTQNGSSMMKTAEGAVSSTVEILKSLKEKAINAANDTNKDSDRTTIQKEIDQFIDQIDDNALTTFNGKYLVDGSKKQAGNATKTAMTNQSLAIGTEGSDRLTALKNRNGESLEIASTDYVTASYVKDGKTHTTTYQVSDTTLEDVFSNLNKLGDEVFGAANLGDGKKTATVNQAMGHIGKDVSSETASNVIAQSNATATTVALTKYLQAGRTDTGDSGKAINGDVVDQATLEADAKALKSAGEIASGGYVDVKAAEKALKDKIKEQLGAWQVKTTAATDTATITFDFTKEDGTTENRTYTFGSIESTVSLLSASTDVDTTGATKGTEYDRFVNDVMTSIDNIMSAATKKDSNVATDGNLTGAVTGNIATIKMGAKTEATAITAADGTAGFGIAAAAGSPWTYASASDKNCLVDDFTYAYVVNKAASGDLVNASSEVGLATSKDMTTTADGTEGLTVTAAAEGVAGQISGLTISITDSEGNVKKAANASLDAFSTTIFASNESADNALNFQVGAAANQAITVGLEDMRSEALGLKGSDGSKVSVATQDKANAAVNVFDNAIAKALDQQTTIGSIEARLAYTSENLTVSSENTQAAESTIRDADMAKEMTNYTKNNVLLQAAQSMLAQANQSSSAVLSLLQ